jgi:hypothetical protein
MRKTKTPREIHCFLRGVKPETAYAVLSLKRLNTRIAVSRVS